MSTWAEFTEEADSLATAIRTRFEAAETHVLATIRTDGSPRVSGTEVSFRNDDLWIGSMPDAMKARDLIRDGRCAIHAHPHDGGDAKIHGAAQEVVGAEKAAYSGDDGPDGGSHLFRLDLQGAVLTTVENDELVITLWQPTRGVRTTRRR